MRTSRCDPRTAGTGDYLVEILDPRLQPLLDAVWAPLWRNATDEEIEANTYGLPRA